MSITATIIGMAVITFFIKALVFILGDRVGFSPALKQAPELSWRNPQLVAALFAVALCAVTRHQLLTILACLGVFFGWQFFYG